MLACRERENSETHQICVVLRPTVLPADRLNVVADNTRQITTRTNAEIEDYERLRFAARAFLLRVGS